MIWLQSDERFNELAKYDHASGRFSIVCKDNNGSFDRVKTDGFFCLMSGQFVAVYVFDSNLFLRIGEFLLPFTEKISVAVADAGERNRLIVSNSGNEVCSLLYRRNSEGVIVDDPTPFVSDEDFDFGLFLSQLSKSAERRRNIIEYSISKSEIQN